MKINNLSFATFLCLGQLTSANTTYDLSDFGDPVEEFMRFSWEDASIWSNGVPTLGCAVVLEAQEGVLFDEEADEFFEVSSVFTSIALAQPVTIASLEMESDTEVVAAGHNFTVTGTTDNTVGGFGGFLTVQNATMRLGNYLNFNSTTKTLSTSNGYSLTESGNGSQAVLEFENADIQISDAGFNIRGVNVFVRDQNTGLDAFRNFRELRSFFNINDGYQLNIGGNFTLGNRGSVRLQNFGRPTQFTVGGNLINNGRIILEGNGVFNVSGAYGGSGTITTTGTNNQISVFGAYVQEGVLELEDEDTVTFGDDLTLENDLIVNGDGNEISVGGDLINDDSLIIVRGDGTRIVVTGDILQTGGKIDTGPSGIDATILRARVGVYQNEACISGNGTLIMPLNITNSFLQPGNSPGELSLEGDLTITGTSDFEVELAGTVQGESYDHVAQTAGTTSLGGTLTIKVINGFDCELLESDTFTVLTSDAAITGAFTNVASGSRLATDDNLGTFLVTYGSSSSSPNSVVLSNFEAAPVDTISFEEWALSQGFDPTLPPNNDQNGNGIPDILDYAFGGAAPALTQIETSDGDFVWTFGLDKSVTGLLLTSRKSTNLDGNESAGPDPIASGTTASKNLYTITDEGILNSSPRQFYQIGVELE